MSNRNTLSHLDEYPRGAALGSITPDTPSGIVMGPPPQIHFPERNNNAASQQFANTAGIVYNVRMTKGPESLTGRPSARDMLPINATPVEKIGAAVSDGYVAVSSLLTRLRSHRTQPQDTQPAESVIQPPEDEQNAGSSESVPEVVINAWQTIHGFNKNKGGPTTKKYRESEAKKNEDAKEANQKKLEPIFDGVVNEFHESVKNLPQRDMVKVYRLVRAYNFATDAKQNPRDTTFLRRYAYKKTGLDIIATHGKEVDGSKATLAEFVRGKEEQGGHPKYEIAEETTGWVVDLSQGMVIDSKHLEELVKKTRDAKGKVTKHLEDVVSSMEEKWLAEILLYGRPMDREAYTVLGARGDGTFSRLSVDDDGNGGVRLGIVSAQNERIVVSSDGRSWAKVHPVVGSKGTAYVVLSDNERSGEKFDPQHGYPDDLFVKMCALVAKESGYAPDEFIRRFDGASDRRSNSPVAIVRSMREWVKTKKTT